jgi:sec-independent protein translocase protein TatA
MIGVPELLVILVILTLLFGASRLPKLARALGEARRELTAASAEPDED